MDNDNLKYFMNSIITNRNALRNALIALNIPLSSSADLEDCVNAVKSIDNNTGNTSVLSPILCNFVKNEDGFVYGSGVSGYVTDDVVFKIPIGSGSSGASSNLYNYVRLGYINRSSNTSLEIPLINGKSTKFLFGISTRQIESGLNNVIRYFVFSNITSSSSNYTTISEGTSFTGNKAPLTVSHYPSKTIVNGSTSFTFDTAYFYIAINSDTPALFDIS